MPRMGYLVASLAAICWGFVYAQTQTIVDKISPIAALSSFYIIGAIVLAPAFIINHKDVTQLVIANPGNFFISVAASIVAEFLIIWSISLLGGAEAAFIEISYPLWTVLFSILLVKFIPNIQVILGGILIMIGSYIISKYSGLN